MKNIKELIYAAVEENAVVFQELAGNILQARAYDAIESLRPEVGASMFGESSHMKGKDDEDEEDKDEDKDEDEDEDEVKESVREYLNQKGTDKSAEGYADAGMWDRQTAEKHAAKHGGKLVPDPSGKHLVKLPGKKMQEALVGNQHKIDKNKNGKIDGHDFKLLRKKEVEGLEEMSDDERRKELDRFGKKAAQTHGYDHPSDTSKASSSAVKSELKAARKLVAGTAKPYRSPANEEVEGLEERSREELISDIKTLKKPAIRSGFDYPSQNPNKAKTRDLKSFHKSLRSVIKQEYKSRNEDVEQIDEVDHPKNQADMLAHIMHQIKVTGHPVATDAQFRATHGKDTTKKASLEPGQDKVQYAIAQGGNVKP